jgi:hypothetical protein
MEPEVNALPQAQEGTAAPAEVVIPEPVTPGAAPQAEIATPESEVARRKAETRERIEELNARAKAGTEYGEYWRQRFEESQRAAPVVTPVVQDTPDPEPDADAYDDPKDFTKAYAAWSRKELDKGIKRAAVEAQTNAEAAAQRTFAKAKEEERLKALNDQFGLKQQQFAEKNPGYWDAVRNPALSFFNGDFLEAIKSDENGPQIAMHIANTPAVVAKLASQSVPQRLATLGRIAAELSRPALPPKVTAAPAPPSPIGGGSGGEVDPSKLSVDDWMAHRTKEIQAKRLTR